MYNPYEIMYDATMDVYRMKPVEIDGFTEHEEVQVLHNVRCRYSSSGQVAARSPDPLIITSKILFCGIDADIKEGDRVVVHLRTGKAIVLRLGECHPYSYQWQCEVTREDHV